MELLTDTHLNDFMKSFNGCDDATMKLVIKARKITASQILEHFRTEVKGRENVLKKAERTVIEKKAELQVLSQITKDTEEEIKNLEEAGRKYGFNKTSLISMNQDKAAKAQCCMFCKDIEKADICGNKADHVGGGVYLCTLHKDHPKFKRY